jgi:hypothetical protein
VRRRRRGGGCGWGEWWWVLVVLLRFLCLGEGGVDVIGVGGVAVLAMLLLCCAIAVWGRGGWM